MKTADFHEHLAGVRKYLADELSKLRVGRASAGLVEDIMVEAYAGSAPLPIKELGSVQIPDAQSILITPWDKSVLASIEKAIRDSGKGLNPVNEGDNLRIPVPPLTEERRKGMAKEISQLVEQAKIRVRTLRKDVIKSVEEQEDNGVISEDDMNRQKKEIEAKIADINKELEEMGDQKAAEVMTI